MNSLSPFHSAFLAALQDADDSRIAVFLDRPDALARMAVYRNTTLNGQMEALASAYPSIVAGMGEARFRELARAYVHANPARSRSFALYGAGLDAFIATYAQDDETRVFSDLAALDRAWLEAHSAADAEPLAPEALQGLDLSVVVLIPHPSARCVQLRYESIALWSALKDQTPIPSTLSNQPSAALLWRRGNEIAQRTLGPGEAVFFTAALGGATLGAAVSAATAADPDFNAAGSFAGFLAAGLFSGVARPMEPIQ